MPLVLAEGNQRLRVEEAVYASFPSQDLVVFDVHYECHRHIGNYPEAGEAASNSLVHHFVAERDDAIRVKLPWGKHDIVRRAQRQGAPFLLPYDIHSYSSEGRDAPVKGVFTRDVQTGRPGGQSTRDEASSYLQGLR